MKTNGIKRILAGTFTVAAIFAVSVVTAVAQQHGHTHTGQSGQQADHTGHGQMAAMPYDLSYIDVTIMHHEQGIEMARLAQGKGTDARVKAFAKKTGDAQQRDLMVLRGHRQNWYSDRPQMDHTQMMAHMQSMPGHQNMQMDPATDMAKLQATEGRAFDRLFLATMTQHHKMAVDMSEEATTKAERSEIKDFARMTVSKQQTETAEMNRINAALGGKPAVKTTKAAARKPAPKKKAVAKKPAPAPSHGHEH